MKTLITNIIIFFTLFFGFIICAFLITNNSLNSPEILQFNKKYHKLVLGDSQAQCSINDQLSSSTINLALAADSYFYSFVKLKVLLHANPQIDTVYIALASINLSEYAENKWDRSSSLIQKKMPKYLYFFDVNDLGYLFSINTVATIKSIINIPKYALKIGLKKILYPIRFKDLDLGGFEALTRSKLQKEIIRVSNEPVKDDYKISKLQTKNLQKVCTLCNENNVKLIFFHAPMYSLHSQRITKKEKDTFSAYYKANLSQYSYLNYSNLKMTNDCYSDLVHLTLKGANIFTQKFFSDQMESLHSCK